MKKLYAFFVGLALLITFCVPSTSKGVVLAPYFNFTVHKNSIGADANFPFTVDGYNPAHIYNQSFEIQTQQGAGTFFTTIFAGLGTTLFLKEVPMTGWRNTEINCNSDNPNVTISYIEGGISIQAQPFSGVECFFVNVQKSNKSPVLLIPGVLGSEIKDNGSDLWVDLDRMKTDLGDQFMDPIAFRDNLLPIGGVVGNILKRPTGTPAFVVNYDYTQSLINELVGQGYTEDEDLFTFPYDWRYGASGKNGQGERVNEQALAEKINDIRQATGSDTVDVVAHSTGGLLVKQYVRDNPNSHGIGKAVFVGVPNLGAPKAVKVLLSGDNFGIPWLADEEMHKIGKNLPVLYDLAPSSLYTQRKGSFLKTIQQRFLARDIVTELGYDSAWAMLVEERGVNGLALAGAKVLHTSEFDDYDIRTNGVDLYNIVGCRAGTIGQIVERRSPNLVGSPDITYDVPIRVPGDGTVPLESATNVPVDASKRFYALKSDHGKMMSQDGIKQLITNLVSGSSLPTQDITQNISQCKLNGKAHAIFSPVDVEVVDAAGNRLGFASDGSVENTIPNASFEVFGEHKFFYLPDDAGQQYDIRLKGTGIGTFTYKVSEIETGTQTRTAVFSDLPVTPALRAVVDDESSVPKLVLDLDGNGQADKTVLPTAVVASAAQDDLVAPVTTAKLIGTKGVGESYRSSITASVSATDTGGTAPASGVARTYISLDGSAVIPYTNPIKVESEGKHVLTFFSVDKNANHELVQQKEFWIDTTPPELAMSFDATAQDLAFVCKDSGSAACTIVEKAGVVTLTDQAGNITKVRFKQVDRKKSLRAELESISYNGKRQDITDNRILFFWQFDKSKKLVRLYQFASNRNTFYVLAEHNGKNTTVTNFGRSGVSRQQYSGLALVEVMTRGGDMLWVVR